MKIEIRNSTNEKSGSYDLPVQFSESYHPNLIKRAVHALQSKARQRYGADPRAGKRHSSKLSKRRRKYRGCYGFGISRVNRKIHSRRGTRFHWVGTFSPQTVGGRRSHAPKAEKIWDKKINQKENRKAIRSAMAATVDLSLVSARGHKVPKEYPFVMSSDFEKLTTTKDVVLALKSIGFADEIVRSSIKKVRSGKGKMRGRKYKMKKGVLIVVSDDSPLIKAAKNIPGVDVVKVHALNAEILAPGTHAGRATLWSKAALETLMEKKLFI
jgi:large subunit ribosomal protein L4e